MLICLRVKQGGNETSRCHIKKQISPPLLTVMRNPPPTYFDHFLSFPNHTFLLGVVRVTTVLYLHFLCVFLLLYTIYVTAHSRCSNVLLFKTMFCLKISVLHPFPVFNCKLVFKSYCKCYKKRKQKKKKHQWYLSKIAEQMSPVYIFILYQCNIFSPGLLCHNHCFFVFCSSVKSNFTGGNMQCVLFPS